MYATDLVEADVGGLLTEALTADVQAVLADQTGLVRADAAVQQPHLNLNPPTTAIMSHESVWYSRPRNYGKGAREW